MKLDCNKNFLLTLYTYTYMYIYTHTQCEANIYTNIYKWQLKKNFINRSATSHETASIKF